MRELIAHGAWADALLWEAALRTPGLRDDARGRELLHHVHAVQWAYLQLTRGEAPAVPEDGEFEDLEALRDWGRRYHEEAAAYFADIGAAGLGRELLLPWADQLAKRYGVAQRTDVRQGILQVAMHSAYHRGQVATRIRALGGEAPLTDFIVWVWAGRPAAPWPARPDA